MPRLCPTAEEIEQFKADTIATLDREISAQFDLRYLSMSSAVFRPAHEWTSEQLAMVRCVTAKDVAVERIIPSQYLPPSDDPELERAFKEVDLAFHHPSGGSDFHGLPKAIAEANSPPRSPLHTGATILHIFCSGISSKYEHSKLRGDLSIQHMIGSTEQLRWYMGGSPYSWSARSSGYLYLESHIEGKTLQGPLVTQSIYTEAPEQIAVMLAIASGFCGFSKMWENHDVYQLTLDKPAILRINHIHFRTRHLTDLMSAISLPADLSPSTSAEASPSTSASPRRSSRRPGR